jgi:hypothetical protein
VLVAIAALVAGSCGHHGDGLIKGKIDLGITTTTGTQACDAPEEAERALSEATVNFSQFSGADWQAVDAQVERLAASVPPSLASSVAVIKRAFTQVRAHPRANPNPFDSLAYANADQAVLRYVQGGCGSGTTTSFRAIPPNTFSSIPVAPPGS